MTRSGFQWLGRTLLAGMLATGIAPPAAAATDPGSLLGRWRTQAENGVVEIRKCGATLCGRIIDGDPLRADPNQRDVRNKTASLRTRPIRNLLVLENFTGGPTEFKGGPVYDPVTGDAARLGYLELENARTLKVQGCIASFLCRTQRWTRLD